MTSVSSASYLLGPGLASDSIASSFGVGFGTSIQVATAVPLPHSLAETSVVINDRGGAGADRACPLFFVSPGQINFYVPAGLALGPAIVKVVLRGVTIAQAQVNITSVSPALYTANANGAGVPAARAIFVAQSGAQSNPAVFQCGASGCLPVAMSLGSESEALYLELYGTGIRGRSALSAVKAMIGGVSAEVLYAGANPNFVGLDQVNVKVPRSLLHRGEVQLLLTVDGQQANPVALRFQ